jgi:hypothetical protein
VDEPAFSGRERGQAEAVYAAVVASGAKVGDVRTTTDAQGGRHSEMHVSYRTDQPTIAQVSQALDAVARQSGTQLLEHSHDRGERQQAARAGQERKPDAHELER